MYRLFLKIKQGYVIGPLLFLLIISIFFRFYNLDKRSVFFADEERDAYVVYKTIIKDHHLTLIGPSTSVGNIYLGPGWYYFLLPWYFVFNGDPIASPVAVSAVGILTTVLFYLFGKEIFNKKTGFLSAIIYTSFGYIVSITSRAWNPSLIPLFSLLFIYGLVRLKKGDDKYWWLITLSFAIGIQFHLTAILFVPILLIFIFLNKIKIPSFKMIILNLLFLILLLFPLILFDLRHDFWNSRAIFTFLNNLITGGSFGSQKLLLNEYYYSIFYPVIIFIISYIWVKVSRNKYFQALLVLFVLTIIVINIPAIFSPRELSLKDKKEIVQKIINKLDNDSFKLIILGPDDYKYGFRYLFYYFKKEPEESPVDQDYQHFYKASKKTAKKTAYLYFDDIPFNCPRPDVISVGNINACILD